ncbi:SRPBCC family protein [Nocardia sp. BMG111209]|uniref:SRPBCC family protein n=1 Tax=Nocardia sp. BMG111209 TaxID=1160137 RepID=UPI00037644C6|nr:SRPBCC family protein [Nocardia sp. BMG111209]
MATIRHEVLIDASPRHIWDVIRDVGAVHRRLLPGRVVGTRIEGVERFLTFPDGHVVRELIVAVDDEARRLAYTVVDGARPALDHHHASFEVQEAGERGRLVWTTDILPDSAAPAVRRRTGFGIIDMKQAIETAAPDRVFQFRTQRLSDHD